MDIPEPQPHEYENLSDDINRKITVVSRVRPPILQEPEEECVINSNPFSFIIEGKTDKFGVAVEQMKKFQFDHTYSCFDSNEYVYDSLQINEMLKLFLYGGLATIMAFGQTSSGKTYTMNYIERVFFENLFTCEKKYDYQFFIKYVQILGDKCTDLLSSSSQEVKILEDKFGTIQLVGAEILEVHTVEEALYLISQGMASRVSRKTQRNNASSRSHAVLCIECKNNSLSLLENGLAYFVDLAGSEGAKDMENHDQQALKEAIAINSSLAVLKDCLRNRTLASSAEGYKRHIHIPYRNSKLTLLLKQAFEFSSSQHSHTMIIATTTPLHKDARHSANTLAYVQPMKVAIQREYIPPPNCRNPATWSPQRVDEWITKETLGRIAPQSITLGEMTGIQLCRLSEGEFIERAIQNRGVGEKFAKEIYIKLWGLVVDAKEQHRKEALKPKVSQAQRKRELEEFDLEMIERCKEGR